jgi:hypothetical protein
MSATHEPEHAHETGDQAPELSTLAATSPPAGAFQGVIVFASKFSRLIFP